MIQFPDQPQIATLCSGMSLAFLLKFLHITVFPSCTCRRTCCRTVCSSTMMLVVLHSSILTMAPFASWRLNSSLLWWIWGKFGAGFHRLSEACSHG